MRKYLFFEVAGSLLLVSECNYKGEPVEFANACEKFNDNKRVEIVGFFDNTGGAMGSSSTIESMRCPISFLETKTTETPIRT